EVRLTSYEVSAVRNSYVRKRLREPPMTNYELRIMPFTSSIVLRTSDFILLSSAFPSSSQKRLPGWLAASSSAPAGPHATAPPRAAPESWPAAQGRAIPPGRSPLALDLRSATRARSRSGCRHRQPQTPPRCDHRAA